MINRARRKDLFQYEALTELQKKNNKLNTEEIENAPLKLQS